MLSTMARRKALEQCRLDGRLGIGTPASTTHPKLLLRKQVLRGSALLLLFSPLPWKVHTPAFLVTGAISAPQETQRLVVSGKMGIYLFGKTVEGHPRACRPRRRHGDPLVLVVTTMPSPWAGTLSPSTIPLPAGAEQEPWGETGRIGLVPLLISPPRKGRVARFRSAGRRDRHHCLRPEPGGGIDVVIRHSH